jgi:hypothetical protein
VHLVQEFKVYWPHEYVVRDSKNNSVDLENP